MKFFVSHVEVDCILVEEEYIVIIGIGGYPIFWLVLDTVRIHPTFREYMRMLIESIQKQEGEE